MRLAFWTHCVLYALCASVGMAQTATPTVVVNPPLDIQSAELTVDIDGKTAVFSGGVTAERGDLTLTSVKLVLNQAPNGDINEIIAEGSVTIRKGTDMASGDRAVFTPTDDMLTLTGEVLLQRGGNTLRGEVLHYNLKDGTLNLSQGNGPRVRANITPGDLTPEDTEPKK